MVAGLIIAFEYLDNSMWTSMHTPALGQWVLGKSMARRSAWRFWEDADLILGTATGQPWESWGSLFIYFLNFQDEQICVCSAHLTGG